ncbi:MAG TPA: 3'-5' exonuclease [Lachnospiraceae bacterium]|nr:3'-5' exonuclease [Lachnospiraceae bacterium]
MSEPNNRYVCVDIETTGLNPKTDKIIEMGAVFMENGVCKRTFETFIYPGRKLSDKIVQLTGITDADLATAPKICEILPEFLDFVQDACLLGHSILFDYAFIKRACVNQKYEFERKGLDTFKIARRYLSDLESRSLDYLCQYYHIPHKAHRALEDAKATCALFERLSQDFGEQEGASANFTPRQLQYRVKREQPITPVQKERLYKLIAKHKITVDYDLDYLTRNEASRNTDLILAKFGR